MMQDRLIVSFDLVQSAYDAARLNADTLLDIMQRAMVSESLSVDDVRRVYNALSRSPSKYTPSWLRLVK
jgi:hypothetical protein